MLKKIKENKKLCIGLAAGAAAVLAIVVICIILLNGGGDGGWSMATRPQAYVTWPTNELGEIVVPTDESGNMVIPTDEAGNSAPTDEAGRPVNPTKPQGATDKDNNDPSLDPSIDPTDVTVRVIDSEDFVEPGPGALNVDLITGFTPVQRSAANTVDGVDQHGVGDVGHAGIVLGDEDLTLEYVGRYTGPYVEDGSDALVENCLSIIVTNNSDFMLQISNITLRVNDAENVNFRVTNLPAGASAMVMAEDRRTYEAGDVLTYGDIGSGYLPETDLMEDTFRVTGKNGKIQVENLTDQSFDQIYIYYKYVQLGGAYLGGITYRVPVTDIGPNQTVTVESGHWSESNTRLSMIEIVE